MPKEYFSAFIWKTKSCVMQNKQVYYDLYSKANHAILNQSRNKIIELMQLCDLFYNSMAFHWNIIIGHSWN